MNLTRKTKLIQKEPTGRQDSKVRLHLQRHRAPQRGMYKGAQTRCNLLRTSMDLLVHLLQRQQQEWTLTVISSHLKLFCTGPPTATDSSSDLLAAWETGWLVLAPFACDLRLQLRYPVQTKSAPIAISVVTT